MTHQLQYLQSANAILILDEVRLCSLCHNHHNKLSVVSTPYSLAAAKLQNCVYLYHCKKVTAEKVSGLRPACRVLALSAKVKKAVGECVIPPATWHSGPHMVTVPVAFIQWETLMWLWDFLHICIFPMCSLICLYVLFRAKLLEWELMKSYPIQGLTLQPC